MQVHRVGEADSYSDPYPFRTQFARLAGVKPLIATESKVGYISNLKRGPDPYENLYFPTQFVLAPTLLVAAGTDGVVLLWARWTTSAGTTVGRPASTRIPRDLGPGEHVVVTMVTWTPAEEGGHTLELSVGQGPPDGASSWRAGQKVVGLEIANPR